MEQEEYTDQKVKEVIKTQKQALNEAELEAQNLAESLAAHQMTVAKYQRQDDMKQFREELSTKVQDKEEHHHDSATVQLEEGAKIGTETNAKVQAKLESKVQKLLDELTVLTNNQYGNGKHVYDYQLVRLTESQVKEESEALAKADEVFFKHSTLKREEQEMNEKFAATKA